MQERIKKILEYSGLNQQDFANRIAISPASLTNILKGRSNATLPIVMSIRASFPEVNFNWLLDGKGDMLTESSAPEDVTEDILVLPQGDLFGTLPSVDQVAQVASDSQSRSAVIHTGGNPPLSASPSAQPYAPAPSVPIVKYVDKPVRHVKEIQVFYDDGTYEVFVPRKG